MLKNEDSKSKLKTQSNFGTVGSEYDHKKKSDKTTSNDDIALKKKLQREELRKREFDRKLQREVMAIESVLTTKYQNRQQVKIPDC